MWVIPRQINQIFRRDWHDQHRFLWNFTQLLYPMRYAKTQNIIFFGQVLFEIWGGEVWPEPLDPEPSNACISAPMIARKVILVSFFSILEALCYQFYTTILLFLFCGHIPELTTLTLILTSTRFFKNLKKFPFVVSYVINILWKI